MSNTSSKQSETIEINMTDLKPFLMPFSVFLSSLVLAMGFFFGLSNIGNSLKGGIVTTGTGTTAAAQPTPDTTGTAAQPNPTVSIDTIRAAFTDDSISFGDRNSNLLLVEVADPSCPYCHIAAGKNPQLNSQAGTQFVLVADGGTYVAPVPEFKKLVDEGKAAFLYIFSNGSGSGRIAAQAQYCAHERGQFWPVHDLLMSNEGYTVIREQVKNDVAQAGVMADFLSGVIDPAFMKSCLESKKYEAKLTSDEALAASLGVSGTPGFFVNETNFPGAYSYTDMQAVVEAAL